MIQHSIIKIQSLISPPIKFHKSIIQYKKSYSVYILGAYPTTKISIKQTIESNCILAHGNKKWLFAIQIQQKINMISTMAKERFLNTGKSNESFVKRGGSNHVQMQHYDILNCNNNDNVRRIHK